MRQWVTPARAHYATLIVAIPILAVLARNQWFFFDDWTFIEQISGPLDPHNGHLSLLPLALYRGLLGIFGLSVYWPYWLLVLVAHLALVHLVWRSMLRSGVLPWIATFLATVLFFVGAAAENILWGFQVGFVGALALGVAAILILASDKLTVPTIAAVNVLAVAAFASSGTSIPLVAVAVLVGLRRHRVLKTVFALALPIALYATWYLTIGRLSQLPSTARTAGEVLLGVPEYALAMFEGGFERMTPIPLAGGLLLIVLIAWLFMRPKAIVAPATLVAYALFLAGMGFALLTGYTRLGLGIDAAASERYVYVTILFSAPLLGIILSKVVQRGWVPLSAVCVFIVLVAGNNLGMLIVTASNEGEREQGSRTRMLDALSVALADRSQAHVDEFPDPEWAPSITVGDLIALHDQGLINPER
jgi:hypothetical protein